MSDRTKCDKQNLDIEKFHQGTNFRSYCLLGAHLEEQDGENTAHFAVWAPNAKNLRIIGSFNGWQGEDHEMEKSAAGGIWMLSVPGVQPGDLYKYEIITEDGQILKKADPYAFSAENDLGGASQISKLDDYSWGDADWMEQRRNKSYLNRPMNIYEIHAGSWKRHPDGRYYNYRELADSLIPYVLEMGYTHVEFLPLTVQLNDGSLGSHVAGYYAAAVRDGSNMDLMYLIDRCHQEGIGVIFQWVPGEFAASEQGLARFDGSALFESADDERGNSEWGTVNFDYEKPEIHSFLISNAFFWLDIYHIDGLRAINIANMLYLNYNREHGEWLPNRYGGRENLEAVAFAKKLNDAVAGEYPGVLIIAEDRNPSLRLTKPSAVGGLGFNFIWNMKWMSNILKYMESDYEIRQNSHHLLTDAMPYAYTENYILALPHHEVVQGKKSYLDKMPGDYWRKFANLRTLLGFMMAYPGKKMIFMGTEFGQFSEWRDHWELDWLLLDFPMHRMLQDYVRDLNRFYLNTRELWDADYEYQGFRWIDENNNNQCVLSFIRYSEGGEMLIALINFSPVVYENFRLGIPETGTFHEVFNSDDEKYGGSGQKNDLPLISEQETWNNQPHSIVLKVPPLGVTFIKKI